MKLAEGYRVVVPMVAGIGNALLALPMVRQLVAEPRRPRVTIVSRSEAMAEPFRRIVGVDSILVTGKKARAMIAATRQLSPEVYLVPFPSNRWQYNLLAATSGAKLRLLHEYPPAHRAAGRLVSGATRIAAERGLHDVVQNLRLLRLLEIEPDETELPRFQLNEEDRAAARALLGGLRDFIVIHAGSAQTVLAQAKRWPPVKYAQLIMLLRQQFGRPVVIVEGPDEAGVAAEIASLLDVEHRSGVTTIPLRGSLGTAAALLEQAALYVGTDSGLAHLAAAVGTRAVTLFAPADPSRVCPSGNRDLVVQPPCECSPCMPYPWAATKPSVRCGEPMCITRIDVERVMEKVASVL